MMAYENYGDSLRNAVFDYAEADLRRRGRPVAKFVGENLAKGSDTALESGYKISYEVAEHTLPPKLAGDVERQLRISTNTLKAKYADNLKEATVEVMNSSITALVSVAKNEKSLDEAGQALASQSASAVKTIVIERGKRVAINEAQRIGTELAGQSAKKIIRQVSGKNNPVLNAMAVGGIVKDLALDWADGKISDEQFVKLFTRRCTVLVLKSLAANVPGGIFAGAAIDYACNELFALMDAAEFQASVDRRRIIAKIKADALTEMNRQRGLMEKYFAEEKREWDKNIQAGFKLIASGTYSNDVEVIAKGLDKILQNFGGQVAFNNSDDFRKNFRQRKIVVNL